MAFFGMLIGNGHAGVGGAPAVPAVTDNATELLNALNTANVGNILDKLATLNTAADPDIKAETVETGKGGAYKYLSDKLTNAGIKYDAAKKYYLRNNDSFSDYIKTKLGEEIKAIKTGGIEDQYKKIIDEHRNTVYKQTNADEWKGKVSGGNTCVGTDVDDIKNKIGKLYNDMVETIKNERQKILKELLKEKMVAEIKRAGTYENIIDYDHVKRYAKGEVEKIIEDKIAATVAAAVNTALKDEIDDALLGNAYIDAINDKAIKDKRQKILKELLTEKMKEHIGGLEICEQEEAVKQYAKDEVSKIIKGKKLNKGVTEFLEKEITNKLLGDAMNANKTVYEKK